jgi:hypothetical protein
MALVMVDGDLCLVEGEEITHVFEKGTLSRPSYKHMCAWAITNFDPKLSVDELWANAKEAWDSLSAQNKTCIWSICNQELQNAQDIKDGLLANLSEYQGYPVVKDAYIEAIKSVLINFE